MIGITAGTAPIGEAAAWTRSTDLKPQVNDMTRNRKTEVQELTLEEIKLVAGGLKLMGEMLSNVSKTRSEISMTFARNARA